MLSKVEVWGHLQSLNVNKDSAIITLVSISRAILRGELLTNLSPIDRVEIVEEILATVEIELNKSCDEVDNLLRESEDEEPFDGGTLTLKTI